MNSQEIKNILFKKCKAFVTDREQTVTQIIKSNQQGLQSETKSSAGDKHETGRAMLQLEMEKASQQLEGIYMLKSTLTKVEINDSSDIARLGSLIITNHAKYFLAISAGEIRIENKQYYAISLGSPIGRLLLGKKVGDAIVFNKKSIVIDKVY